MRSCASEYRGPTATEISSSVPLLLRTRLVGCSGLGSEAACTFTIPERVKKSWPWTKGELSACRARRAGEKASPVQLATLDAGGAIDALYWASHIL